MTTLSLTDGLPSGTQIDRYTLVREIAHGGMGSVYVARLVGPGGFLKNVGLKLAHPHLARDPHFVNMFLDEARLAATLHHANLVQVFDTGTFQGLPYLVMEWLAGQPLSRCIVLAREQGVRLPPGFVAAVVIAAARGLHAAHEARDATGASLRIVHRDVSPQNLHVGYDGHVKVLDFGIALSEGRLVETTSANEFKGKLAYCAPEQLDRRHPIDRRADVWSLGVVAWECLTGRPLFAGSTERDLAIAVLEQPIPKPSELVPDLPSGVDGVIARALARLPDDRAPTAEAFASWLEAVLPPLPLPDVASLMGSWFGLERITEESSLKQAVPTPSSPPKALSAAEPPPLVTKQEARPTVKRRAWLIGGLGALVLAVIAGIIASREPEPLPPAPAPVENVVPAIAPPNDPSGLELDHETTGVSEGLRTKPLPEAPRPKKVPDSSSPLLDNPYK